MVEATETARKLEPVWRCQVKGCTLLDSGGLSWTELDYAVMDGGICMD